MVLERGQRRSPPYISYRTYRNFIEGFQQGIPARIDRSYWGDKLSGSTGTQLVAALNFLGLIDASGVPTSRLRSLATAQGEQRKNILRQVISESYSFLLHGTIDLQTATYAQLGDIFHNTFQLAGDVNRKCIKFFTSLAADAEMPLSPHITKKFRAPRNGNGTKIPARKVVLKGTKSSMAPQNPELVPNKSSWDEMLVSKFPTFDPAWSEDVKLKWFDAFDMLLKRSPAG